MPYDAISLLVGFMQGAWTLSRRRPSTSSVPSSDIGDQWNWEFGSRRLVALLIMGNFPRQVRASLHWDWSYGVYYVPSGCYINSKKYLMQPELAGVNPAYATGQASSNQEGELANINSGRLSVAN